jgi:hypothetical protein
MNRRFISKLISTIAAICLILPLFAVQVSAVVSIDGVEIADLENDLQNALNLGRNITVTGDSNDILDISIFFARINQTIEWAANTPGVTLTVQSNAVDTVNGGFTDNTTFRMTGGALSRLYLDSFYSPSSADISGSANIGSVSLDGGSPSLSISDSAHIGTLTLGGEMMSLYIGPNVTIEDPIENLEAILPDYIQDEREQIQNDNEETPAEEDAPESKPIKTGDEIKTSTPAGKNSGGSLTVTITDDEPFEEDGLKYAGKVDIKEFFTDTPKSIPDVVFINGKRYLVGDVVYIVAKKDLEIVGYTKTGLAYIFPAVENVEKTVVFTASNLPEGLALTEDGILYTEKLPLKRGITEIYRHSR